MALLQVNGVNSIKIEELYSRLRNTGAEMEVMHNGQKQTLLLPGQAARGIMVASVFPNSPADAVGLPAGASSPESMTERWRMLKASGVR